MNIKVIQQRRNALINIAPSAIYDGQDAADPTNEGNNTNGWSVFSGTGSINSVTDPSDGTYAIECVCDSNGATVFRVNLTSYLSYNTAYNITVDHKKTVGSFNYRMQLQTFEGWTADLNGALRTGSNPVTYTTETFSNQTTAASGNIFLRFNFTSSAVATDAVVIDNIVIEEV